MKKINKLVYGVGINDANYKVNPIINGKQVMCPFYMVWRDRLKVCYSSKYQAKHPTYIGCTVCEEWLTFSNFKSWMEAQDWQGKELDKDLLFVGNKIYSPETCAFVSAVTNTFVTDRGADRGNCPIGVTLRGSKFQVKCCNPFNKKNEYLGLFICPNQAHLAWKKRKHEHACQLADLQTDGRVAKALRERYALQDHN